MEIAMANDLPALRVRYWNIMQEIKDRLKVIEGIYKNQFKLPATAAYELCYLELRLTCELIALACLTAHADIPAARSRDMRDEYRPGKLLASLERLHPAFYPVPMDQIIDVDGNLEAITRAKNGSLTRSELVRLHGESGNILHRGAIKKYEPKRKVDFRKAAAWQKKIIRLLNRHLIAMVDQKHAVYVTMQDKITKNPVLLELEVADVSHWPDWIQALHQEV